MKIMIIGNGFDLNLGFKTSYQDFLESQYFKSLVNDNNSLALYLDRKNNLLNWVDIENEITNYSIKIIKLQHEEKINLTTADIKNHFKSLKVALIQYLKEVQEQKLNEKSKAFEMIRHEIESTHKIYNFNYTNSIFQVTDLLGIDRYEIEDKHTYVHGSIENTDIIFGVEDYAKISTEHIFFKKSYNINFGKSDIISNLNYKNNLILFGHSLGITDSAYFKDYIASLYIHRGYKTLKFYYYGVDGYDELMQVLDKYTRNNITKFKHNNQFFPIDSSANN